MNLIQLRQQKEKQKQQELLDEIVSEIKKFDDAYFDKREWKRKGFTCYGYRPRTIQMKGGVLRFNRRYYRKRKNGTGGYFPVDDKFEIERYARIGMDIKQLIYDWFTTMKVTKIAELTDTSKMTVYNTLNSLGKKDLMYVVEADETVKRVFIQADEKHLSLRRRKKDSEARLIMVYTGRQKECNNRYKLMNKHYFLFTDEVDHNQKWQEVYDYIDKKYPQCNEYYLGADGGRWIVNGKDAFPRLHYIYDKFHFVQSLMRIFGGSAEGRRQQYVAYKYIKKDDKKAFLNIAQKWIVHAEENHLGNIKNRTNEMLKICKNIRSIRNNWLLTGYGGTSAEGHISHYVASTFASRPKGFSSKRFSNYLRLVEYKLNGLDFASYGKAKFRTFMSQFSITGDDIFDDISRGSNIPAMYSQDVGLRRLLKSTIR